MRSDLDGDREGVYEVIRNAVRVPGGVNSHRHKLTLERDTHTHVVKHTPQ